MLVEDEQHFFPAEMAGVVVGSHVLVGLTYVTTEGQVDRQEQLHGFVSRVDAQGVRIQVWGTDQEFNLPPSFRGWQLAARSEYRLRSTGEVVMDPDFITTWEIIIGGAIE